MTVVRFDEIYDPLLEDDICRRIHFLAEGITSFKVLRDDVGITGVRCEIATWADPIQISRKVRAGIARELNGVRAAHPKVILDFDNPRAGAAGDVVDQAFDSGMLRTFGPGQVCLSGVLAELFETLDALILAEMDAAGAVEMSLPVLVPTDVLHRSGYFESFPHYVMLVDRLRSDYDDFDSFAEAVASDRLDAVDEAIELSRVSTEYALPPTVCYLIYESILRGFPGKDVVFTARGSTFRFESDYHQPLRRLWDFTMREAVLAGSRAYVEERFCDVRDRIVALACRLELSGLCETANDPFFMSASGAQRTVAQRLSQVKVEMLLRLEPGQLVAVSSFNRHGEYMSRRFQLPDAADGGPTVTACIGVGLERLLLAFIAQHGLDPDTWPESMRLAIQRRREYRRSGSQP